MQDLHAYLNILSARNTQVDTDGAYLIRSYGEYPNAQWDDFTLPSDTSTRPPLCFTPTGLTPFGEMVREYVVVRLLRQLDRIVVIPDQTLSPYEFVHAANNVESAFSGIINGGGFWWIEDVIKHPDFTAINARLNKIIRFAMIRVLEYFDSFHQDQIIKINQLLLHLCASGYTVPDDVKVLVRMRITH